MAIGQGFPYLAFLLPIQQKIMKYSGKFKK